MSTWTVYNKIKKLTRSKASDDVRLGIELLLHHSDELTPKQFYYLNDYWNDSLYKHKLIDESELQQYIYEKRKKNKSIQKNK